MSPLSQSPKTYTSQEAIYTPEQRADKEAHDKMMDMYREQIEHLHTYIYNEDFVGFQKEYNRLENILKRHFTLSELAINFYLDIGTAL